MKNKKVLWLIPIAIVLLNEFVKEEQHMIRDFLTFFDEHSEIKYSGNLYDDFIIQFLL